MCVCLCLSVCVSCNGRAIKKADGKKKFSRRVSQSRSKVVVVVDTCDVFEFVCSSARLLVCLFV